MTKVKRAKQRRGTRRANRILKKSEKRLRDVEDYLERDRFEERTGGRLVDQEDQEIFEIEKTLTPTVEGRPLTKKERRTKPLLSVETITLNPTVKPINVPHKVCRKSSGGKKSKLAAEKPTLKNNTSWETPAYNLWATGSDPKPEGDEHFLRVTRKMPIKLPVNYRNIPSVLPAVEVPHPGASINPTYDDHQALLSLAHVTELQKGKVEKRVTRALDDQFPAEKPGEASWMAEMSAGLFDKETDLDNDIKPNVGLSCNPPIRRENKKTKQQRRKEELAKNEEMKLMKIRTENLNKNDIYRLKTLKKEISEQEIKRERVAQRRAQKKALEVQLGKPKTLGKLKFEAPDVELKLSDELVDSLRLLKPEGNLLEDRFKSLQKRNIIEPRLRAKRTTIKRRYRPKLYEKRDHKNVELGNSLKVCYTSNGAQMNPKDP